MRIGKNDKENKNDPAPQDMCICLKTKPNLVNGFCVTFVDHQCPI